MYLILGTKFGQKLAKVKFRLHYQKQCYLIITFAYAV